MGFRTHGVLRNLFGTAQGLCSTGSFLSSEGSEASNKEEKRQGVSERVYLPLESFADASEPRPLGTLRLEACVQHGLRGSGPWAEVPEPFGHKSLDARLGVAMVRLERSWVELEGLSAYQPQHIEKGRAAARQTSSFNAEVRQCL